MKRLSRLKDLFRPCAEQKPTVSSEPATTSRKEHTMPALGHRELALKLAVEHVTATSESPILDGSNAEIDESYLAGVLALADRFSTWLGSDNAITVTQAQEAAPEPARVRPRQQVLSLIDSKADEYGRTVIAQLRSTAAGLRDSDDAIGVAIGYVREGSLDSLLGRTNARDFLSSLESLSA